MSEGNTDQANDGNEGPPKKSKADVKAAKNAQYADAWGIRKLISHCVRNLRIDRIPPVPRKHFWFYPFPKSSNSLNRKIPTSEFLFLLQPVPIRDSFFSQAHESLLGCLVSWKLGAAAT